MYELFKFFLFLFIWYPIIDCYKVNKKNFLRSQFICETKGNFKDSISAHMTYYKVHPCYLPDDFIITVKGGYVYLHRM